MNKFKHYQQYDSMSCGVTCLAMICSHYGKEYSMDTLSRICIATKAGISLLGISKAAEKLYFKTCVSRSTVKELIEFKFPCILHWNQNHFVVLYEIKKNRFYIADPSKGLLEYTLEEFNKHWINSKINESDKGIVMQIEPTYSFGDYEDCINTEKRSFRVLLNYLRHYRKHFVVIFFGLILSCILQLLMPFLTQSIVDIGIKHNDIGFIWLILLGELFIVVGRTATDYIRNWLLLHISMRINISLISDFFIKLLKLPMVFFDTKLMGDLLQRIGDHSRVQSFLTNQILSIVFTLLSFLTFGIVLFLYNKIIFGVFILGSIVYGIWIAFFLKKRRILDYEMFEKQAINQTKTYQLITSMQEIKLHNCEQRRRWEWEDTQAELFFVQMDSLKMQQTQDAGRIIINELKNITISVLAASAVIAGEMSLGMMLAIQYMIGQLNSPVEQFMEFIYALQDVRISLERINEVHWHKNEESTMNQISIFDGNDKSIDIRNIYFKYDSCAFEYTLKNISFKIPHGKETAIVGASGSGKSTLIKLILGYYDLENGKIEIAGHNIKNYNLKWWRNKCGVVMQDGVIFSESIARNIAIGDGVIDQLRLEYASRIANIYDNILELPLKFNTIIGRDGVGLSQGQKQRILLARVIYKDPDFIFLDEATNALDASNERAIVENLMGFYAGRTVLIVAHRLSTVKNADQIIVMDKGQVVEIGTHISLLEKKGVYFNLVKNQLELGI